ncbi:30S ribosomal protein S13 [archaeon]|jgi:small subunit ribosomal protein S13|nr:30S ribosomal protein S13 [archaeon]MBT6824478.1 30S ribosomal protein S13 [archaeon]MBT7106863.1 30S ribosomal protein S13 [archaeon]MBT7297787.1 30S ribosomal protein S13 [archaeon]
MTEENKDFKHIVRISMTDIDGKKSIIGGLIKVKGIGHSFSNAICVALDLDKNKRIGDLKDAEIQQIEEALKDPEKIGIPSWALNRRKDYDEGIDKHKINIDLKLQKEFDYKRLQKIKSYRGLRLSVGLPVRGQRTRSNFRSNKGKGMGVKKKKK